MRKINELFYSFQGEGYHSGTPAVFVRFSGCNLQCPFCDTPHQQGEWMDDIEIVRQIQTYPPRMVVLTGGEPSLFIDDDFVGRLKQAGKYVAIETNGTHVLPAGIDWITFSPKTEFVPGHQVMLTQCHELKIIYTGQADLEGYLQIPATHYYLQPCDTGDEYRNEVIRQQLVDYLLKHPHWKLSLQLHKIMGVR